MQTLTAANEQLTGIVRDAMTQDVHFALVDDLVCNVAEQMAKNQLRRIIIVDHRNRVVGVVSQRDLLRQYLTQADQTTGPEDFQESQSATWIDAEVGGLISRDKPITVSPDLPLVKAAAVLAGNKIGCLPVVGPVGNLMGVLTTTDVLRHITGRGSERLESAFQLYTPAAEARAKMPAYIRKATGDLVIPLNCMNKREHVTDSAVLGYDPPSGRVLIKFVEGGKPSDGAMKVKKIDEHLVIAAREFVTHFNLIGKATAFDVSVHKDNLYLVLTPR